MLVRNCAAPAAALALMALSPSLARAQAQALTDAQLGRINDLARFSVAAVGCRPLGFQVDPDLQTQVKTAAENEFAASGVNPVVTQVAMDLALAQELAAVQQQSGVAEAAIEKGAGLLALNGFYLRLGQACQQAVNDRIISHLLIMPAGFDAKRAAAELADRILTPGGMASWQTAAIRAHGDLMLMIGACEQQLGDRSTDLARFYAAAAAPREHDYYLAAFHDGQNGTALKDFDEAGCNRAIHNQAAKAGLKPDPTMPPPAASPPNARPPSRAKGR